MKQHFSGIRNVCRDTTFRVNNEVNSIATKTATVMTEVEKNYKKNVAT